MNSYIELTLFYVPKWLSQEFVDKIVGGETTAGLELLRQAWMYRPQQIKFPLQQIRLMKYCRQAVESILAAANHETRRWLDTLDVVKDMPIVLYFACTMPPDEIVIKTLSDSVIGALVRVVAAFPETLARGGYSPLTTMPFEAPNSEEVFAIFGRCLAALDKDGLKRLTKTLYGIKPLYAGGYHATHFAMAVTELLLIGVLSCDNLPASNEVVLQDVIAATDEVVMTPYVHLVERAAAIWDPGYVVTPNDLDKGKIMLNNLLRRALNRHDGDSVKTCATALAASISAIATTLWPYER